MKLLPFLMLLSITSFGQPAIDSVYFIPAFPSEQDSVYAITSVTTGTIDSYMGYETFQNANNIIISICLIEGALLQIENYIDTINLGVQTAGNYNVDVFAHYSSTLDSCVSISSSNAQASFNVQASNLNEYELNPEPILVKIVDLMGRETDPIPNTLLIYVYSDGTTEKVFWVE